MKQVVGFHLLGKLALAAAVVACSASPSDEREGSNEELAGDVQAPLSLNPNWDFDVCPGVARTPPVLDRSRTKPTVDPTTCADLTPKVGFVRVSNLPDQLKNTLTATSVSGTPLGPNDWLLLYVPPMSSDGKRRITLSGDSACNADPCPGTVTCGKPTEEKCPAANVKPTKCASAIVIPGQAPISLAQKALSVDLNGSSKLTKQAYRGVVIAASEITISGPVRTNGNDLVLVAEQLLGQSNPSIDVSALRGPIELPPSPGGRLLVAADVVSAPGLTLRADGAPGALPRTRLPDGTAIHPDCEDKTPNQYGGSSCFPCVDAKLCSLPGYGGEAVIDWDQSNHTCLTHSVITGGEMHSFYDYYFDPIAHPTPASGDGGPPGYARIMARSNRTEVDVERSGGRGAKGLDQLSWCTLAQIEVGAPCTVFPGPPIDGKTPPGAFLDVFPPQTTTSSIGSADEFAQLLALTADEFITADAYRSLAEGNYRSGKTFGAAFDYQLLLNRLGPESAAPCSLLHKQRSLVAEATGKLAQLTAGLDFMGHSPDWAPATAPALLQPQVQSRLEETTALAQDLKLNALLSIAAADQLGKIGLYMNQADGYLAQLQSNLSDIHLREKQAQLAAASTSVERARADYLILQQKLYDYMEQKKQEHTELDIGGIAGALKTLADQVKTLYGAVKDIASATSVGSLAGGYGAAIGAAVGVVNAVQDIAKKFDALNAPGWSCSADPACVALGQQLTHNGSDFQATNLALRAAQLAVQGEQADEQLIQAQQEASLDVVRTLQDSKYVVSSFDDLARAGQALCKYGRMEVDLAVAEEQAFKRAAAVWDAPTPTVNSSVYGGASNGYNYDFNQLISPGCESSSCTLWGDFNSFLTARNQYQLPNAPAPYYLGLEAVEGQNLAKMLKQLVNVPAGTGSAASMRAEIHLGLVSKGSGNYFGALQANSTLDDASVPPVLNGIDLSSDTSIQVVGFDVWADNTGVSQRIDFPWYVSRPSSERYRTQAAPAAELDLDVSVPAGRTLDSGFLQDPMHWDVGSSRFTLANCCDVNANANARPESLEKGWTIWVPVCEAGTPPSQACATNAELQALTAVHIAARLRFRAQ
jgi:hypothetical protein